MSGSRDKVVVAMSGGVDSSVAACLLVEQGYDVIGLFMRVGDHSLPPAASRRLQSARTFGSDSARDPEVGAGKSTHCGAIQPSRPHQGCCSASDAADARFVAGMLGIPFYALNFEDDFSRIIDYFADEYARGRTPNPCVVCNDRLKFGKLVDYADAVGARYIATGHYARIAEAAGFGPGNAAAAGVTTYSACDAVSNGSSRGVPTRHAERSEASPALSHPEAPEILRFAQNDIQRTAEETARGSVLLRGVDRRKDQSYVLFGLRREILDRTLFPIGHLAKDEVRRIAARYGLPNQNKPDSVEICFAPDRDYARVVRDRRPDGFLPGEVVDQEGGVIGRHDGLAHYTVGQRRGLRIAAGKPIYVTRLDVLNNRVVMGDSEDLASPGLLADRANFLMDGLSETFRAQVKIRYLHAAVEATVHRLAQGRVHVVFDEPQRAVTPGQAVVFYHGDVVLGGAWIDAPDDGPVNGGQLIGDVTAELLARGT